MNQVPRAQPVDHQKHVADLQAVLEVSRELSATDDLVDLVRAVEQAAQKVLECERAALLLYDRQRDVLSRPHVDGHEGEPAIQEVLARAVVRTGKRIELDDPASDPRFDAALDARLGIRTRNLAVFPLLDFDKEHIVGVLQVHNTSPLDPWDRELVKVFDAQVGVAVQRQLLLEHYAEKQRIQRDLKLARDIQQGLMPADRPTRPGFDIAGWNEPCDETGGDFWDHHELPDGSLFLALGDATGHGIGAALLMAVSRSFLRATTSISQDMSRVVERVNRLLYDDFPDNRSVTAVLGFLSGDTLSFMSAGHGPIVRYVAAEDRFHQEKAHGIPLGILDDYPWPEAERFRMAAGDMMVLLTDGFFEWENADGEEVGIERIVEVLRRNLGRSSQEMIGAVVEAVRLFVGEVPQNDDLTALVIRKL